MSRLALVLDQIQTARRYTVQLLDHIPPREWFLQPGGAPTHVAWQVGHLAMAQYRLALERIRGSRPDDELLIPAVVLEKYGRNSIPDPDPSRNLSPGELRSCFDRVHAQVLLESEAWQDADLDAPALKPHQLFETKLGALLWCVRHEMMHAGQIGLLRRLAGAPPLW